MYTCILILPNCNKPQIAGDLIQSFAFVQAEPNGRFFATGEDGKAKGWLAISEINESNLSYDPETLSLVRSKVEDPVFYLVEIRNKDSNISNQFILNLDGSLGGMIDNDHGCMESVALMKKLIHDGINWCYFSPEK